MKEWKDRYGLSGSTLKLIAIITMLIDHSGATVLQAVLRHPAVAGDAARRAFWATAYSVSRDIGRIAFPIFCFLVVEGFLHTRNVWKYAGRLFLFALISEIPFDIALKGAWYFPTRQNVYFTLLIGLLVIMAVSFCQKRLPSVWLIVSILPLAAGMFLADRIGTDYSFKGVFLIALLYMLQGDRLMQCVSGAACMSWEFPAPAAFLPVFLYNGRRGLRMKYVFYWFYPAHLMILYVLSTYLIPNL